MKIIFSFCLLTMALISCQNKEQQPLESNSTFVSSTKTLNPYWEQGKGELTIYNLKQNRYADVYEDGEVIVIQVTEDFLTGKQVKNDNYTNQKSTQVLKTNVIKRFTTGIYDYSLMTSVFTPTDMKNYPYTQKVSFSSQDWCGQSFHQINHRTAGYNIKQYSYFENEGDVSLKIGADFLEDELFNRIRIDPYSLPTGETNALPSSEVLRLLHLPIKAIKANFSSTTTDGQTTLTVSYPSLSRTLNIYFSTQPPFTIEGWDDTYPSVFDKKPRTTVATKKARDMRAYWGENNISDSALRDDLKLDNTQK